MIDKEAGLKNRIGNLIGRNKSSVNRVFKKKPTHSARKDKHEDYISGLKDQINKNKHSTKVKNKSDRMIRKIKNLEDKASGIDHGDGIKGRVKRRLNMKSGRPGNEGYEGVVGVKGKDTTFLEEHGSKIGFGAGGAAIGAGGYLAHKDYKKRKKQEQNRNLQLARR